MAYSNSVSVSENARVLPRVAPYRSQQDLNRLTVAAPKRWIPGVDVDVVKKSSKVARMSGALRPDVERVEEEREMLAMSWVVLAEERLRPPFGPDRRVAAEPALAPLTDLEDEVEVVHELVVDDVVVAAVLPQEIGPRAVDLAPELLRAPGVGDRLAEASLERLELGEWLPAGVHLDVEILRGTYLVDREELEPHCRVGVVCEALPGHVQVVVLKLARDRVEHHEHGLDGRVEPPQVEIPTLVLDPQRRASREVRGRGVLDDPLAEQPRTRARCVREPSPWLGVAEAAAAEREVPVQQKQRGEALLPIERFERPVVLLAVDEVETDRLAICQGVVQSLHERCCECR